MPENEPQSETNQFAQIFRGEQSEDEGDKQSLNSMISYCMIRFVRH